MPGTECLENIVVGVSNWKWPNEKDFILCAGNDKCAFNVREPRWLKLRCNSPVEGKYLMIIRNKAPSAALAIAEIKVKDERDILIEMKPGGIYYC